MSIERGQIISPVSESIEIIHMCVVVQNESAQPAISFTSATQIAFVASSFSSSSQRPHLDFPHGSSTAGGVPGGEPGYAALAEWRVEDPVGSELVSQILAATEHPAERHVFPENDRGRIGRQRHVHRVVHRGEQVHRLDFSLTLSLSQSSSSRCDDLLLLLLLRVRRSGRRRRVCRGGRR